MRESAYYLSAILGRDHHSLEVRMKVFSAANLRALLKDDPAAITVGPLGTWGMERLLEALGSRKSFNGSRRPSRKHRWRVYEKNRDESRPHPVRLLDSTALEHQLITMNFDQQLQAAFVSEDLLEDGELMSVIDSVISREATPGLAQAPDRPENLASANRQALQTARQEMLRTVGTYRSEEIASALDSTSSNASQYAADQRAAGKIFGVRFGREWHYPTFQFDRSRKPIEIFDEIKPVLAALSPDERGWDRLQWFLTPHEDLKGLTPLEMWRKNRAAVVALASTERWNGRD